MRTVARDGLHFARFFKLVLRRNTAEPSARAGLSPRVFKQQITTAYKYKRGLSLASCLHDAACAEVVTALVNAEAYPGPSATLSTPDSTTLAWMSRLQGLALEGLVREQPPGQWQITLEGAQHLKVSRTIMSCDRALVPRRGVAIADRRTWELIIMLEADQWKCLPAPKKKSLKPIMLQDDIPVDDRFFYFNRGKLDISCDYLRCLLGWKMIRDRGFVFRLSVSLVHGCRVRDSDCRIKCFALFSFATFSIVVFVCLTCGT